MKSILLIYPPFTAPSAPPLGIASLASSLREGGAEVHLLDLNVEAYDRLLSPDFPTPQDRDTFSERSLRTLPMGVSNLRGCGPSAGFKRYKEIISHLQRALWLRSEGAGGPRVTLGDFSHPSLSPLKTGDLKLMASMRDLGHLKSWMETRLETAINEARPDYVGISVQFLSQALPAMAVAGAVKEISREVKIILGGALISVWWKMGRSLDLSPWVDKVIPGPGLKPLAEMLGLQGYNMGPPPIPDFAGLPLEFYLSPERVLPVATSLGCYWGRCRFCPDRTNEGAFLSMNPEELPHALERISRTWHAPWIHITDSAIPPALIKVLSRSKLQAKWFGFARFEEILQEERVVEGLFDSGCRMLQLGLESASPRMLKKLNKGIRLDYARRVLESLHSSGIATYVYILFGIPGETSEDYELTMDFVLESSKHVDFLHASILNIPRWETPSGGVRFVDLPGGEDKDLSLYVDYRVDSGMDRKSARNYLSRVFLKDPIIRELVKRDPPVFGPVHAALMGQRATQG